MSAFSPRDDGIMTFLEAIVAIRLGEDDWEEREALQGATAIPAGALRTLFSALTKPTRATSKSLHSACVPSCSLVRSGGGEGSCCSRTARHGEELLRGSLATGS